MLTSLFSLFYVTGECHRFLHRGWARVVVVLHTYTRFWGKISSLHRTKERWWRLYSPNFRVRIMDNNNSPHGKFHRFLFRKFSDLNSLPAACYVKWHTQWPWVTCACSRPEMLGDWPQVNSPLAFPIALCNPFFSPINRPPSMYGSDVFIWYCLLCIQVHSFENRPRSI